MPIELLVPITTVPTCAEQYPRSTAHQLHKWQLDLLYVITRLPSMAEDVGVDKDASKHVGCSQIAGVHWRKNDHKNG